MGIFNEQSFDHPFAKGIQGAPGVGFSLTADGNYDMNKKRVANVGALFANTDAATKKYVDDNSSGTPASSRLTVDSDIDMKDTYRIINLKLRSDVNEAATKSYTDNSFLNLDGTKKNDWKSRYGRQKNIKSASSSGAQTTNTISFHRFEVSPRCWN